MTHHPRKAPDTAKLNAQLAEIITKWKARAAKLTQIAEKMQPMSECDHVWKHWVDTSWDGHRTDNSDEYTCTKCGYCTTGLPIRDM